MLEKKVADQIKNLLNNLNVLCYGNESIGLGDVMKTEEFQTLLGLRKEDVLPEILGFYHRKDLAPIFRYQGLPKLTEKLSEGYFNPPQSITDDQREHFTISWLDFAMMNFPKCQVSIDWKHMASQSS